MNKYAIVSKFPYFNNVKVIKDYSLIQIPTAILNIKVIKDKAGHLNSACAKQLAT